MHPCFWWELSALPPNPTNSLLPLAQSPWGSFWSEGADAAFVTPVSACHAITQRMCYTKPELSSCTLSAPSSCGCQRGNGSKDKGRKNRNKGEMDFSWSISTLFHTPHFEKNWSISYSLSTLSRLLILIKINHNLKEIKFISKFFSLFPLRSQNR